MIYVLILGIDTEINSKMFKEAGLWQCSECSYQSNKKSNVYEHVESKHVMHGGYVCPVCEKVCRSKNALRSHHHSNHMTL